MPININGLSLDTNAARKCLFKLTLPPPPLPPPEIDDTKIINHSRPIKMRNLISGEQTVDTLHLKYKNNNQSHACNETRCLASILNPQPVEQKVRSPSETLEHARDFINNFYASIKRLDSPAHLNRLKEIEEQIRTTDTYYLKETELIFGAKLAWRNASRCIGRIQWSKLQVFDARFITTAQEMFEALCNHIKYATNKGSLRSAITILPQRVKSVHQDWRIWNSQLIGYAGYHRNNGEDASESDSNNNNSSPIIIGDPANVELTEICLKLGWQSKRTRFDVLPLVLSAAGGPPQMFPLPEELVLRVKLRHPRLSWWEELGLEWYALPAVSSMMLDVGGLQFTAAPFSGWYMVTEIGARDLGDSSRYNMLEPIAKRMGLNTTTNSSLWRDLALVELNVAVLDSYQSAGVTIVDHHTASETFMTHLANEQRLRGGCPADWVWLVPPTSGSTTQVFHQEMVNYHLLPNYEYLEVAWKNFDWLAWERAEEERRAASAELLARKKLAAAAAVAAGGAQAAIENGKQTPLRGLFATSGGGLNGTGGGGGSGTGVNGHANGELTPRRLRFKEIARAVKFTSKLFGKALSRRIKATILYATETGKSERFANKLAQTFSFAFNVHLMSMSDYDMTCLEHEAMLLIVTSTFGNGDPPENGELFAKHLAAVKLTGDTSPDIDSINAVSTNPFFQMLSEDHQDQQQQQQLLQLEKKKLQHPTQSASQTQEPGASGGPDSFLGVESGDAESSEAARRRRSQQFKLDQQANIRPLSNVRFGVFALGSTAYPHFCAFGRYVDQTLGELGAERIFKCTCGDELYGQEKAFNEWSQQIFKTACDVFCLTDSIGPLEERKEIVWSPRDVRFAPVELIGDSQTPSTAPLPRAHQQQASGGAKKTAPTSTNDHLTSPKTIVKNLLNITGKKIVPFTVRRRADLHKFNPEENLQTLTIDLESDLVVGPGTSGPQVPGSPTLNKRHQTNGSSATAQGQQQQATTPAAGSKLITFAPGDHVGIHPVNKREMVDKLLERMACDRAAVGPPTVTCNSNSQQPPASVTPTDNNGISSIGTSNGSGKQREFEFDFDSVVTILVKRENMDLTPAAAGQGEDNWIPYDRLPITSIREALTRYLDITNAPNQEFLMILSSLTSNQEEKKRLQQMARNFSIYEQWKNSKFPTLLSVLEEFKTVRFEPALITQIPLMKPRFYSISGTNINLTLGVIRYTTTTGEPREGLCSNYLNTVPIDSKCFIYGYIRSAPAFHMPQDKSIPMILISAGTGIAPFRSFWQQRYADMYKNPIKRQSSRDLSGGGGKQQATGTAVVEIQNSLRQSPSGRALTSPLIGQQQQHHHNNHQRPSNNPINMNRSLSQRTDSIKTLFGRIDMYFGCRNSNYILYKDELDQMCETGVLSSIHVAFSRPIDRDVLPESPSGDTPLNGKENVGGGSEMIKSPFSAVKMQNKPQRSQLDNIRQARKRLYVQDKLLEQADSVFKLIMLDGAHVYVCGDVAMADGVYKTLANILNDRNTASPNTNKAAPGSASTGDGERILMNMRNLNRYHEDIFGSKHVT